MLSHKRIKLDAEPSYSSDPFIVLHSDLHDLIHQHLCCNDVCELFKVSKEWNARISKSPKPMEKILLNFRELSSSDPPPKSVTALLKSERMYQNIKFSLRFSSNAYRKLFILKRFSQSVSYLDISFVNKADCTKFIPANLSFPKLKELRLTGVIPRAFFNSVDTVEKLFVVNHSGSVDIFEFF